MPDSENVQKEMSVSELHTLLQKNDPQIIVVDVRRAIERNLGFIPQSRNIPLNELPQHIDELRPFTTIYLVCQSGGRSSAAQTQLATAGFTNTVNVVGGTGAWIAAGLPVEKP